jgi:predicted DNA-binding protein with PD1-like motif
VLSLASDIALDEDGPKVHIHVIVGKSAGTVHSGRLLEAHAQPTVGVILAELPGHLRRKLDKETGLALLRL